MVDQSPSVSQPLPVIELRQYYFSAPVGPKFVQFFDGTVRPQLKSAGIPVLARFVTETSPNNFPRLVVREQDPVFVWVSRYDDQPAHERQLAALHALPAWQQTAASLQEQLTKPPEVLRLQPTPRSQLH